MAADHDREMADVRAQLAAEREWNRERDSNLGSTLQNFLLDVDTLLPAGADAKTIKKAVVSKKLSHWCPESTAVRASPPPTAPADTPEATLL